ncbi:MAG: hypothetical protein NZ651_06340 [Candidatus Bipolaricaulota bacterium]|nr:hypothetical protein [Candidatus Bipolaricaulota bacterium]MDW8127373.1 hypothetical protein [Candidatus Bipolaricaulota bacterium]
MIEYRAELAHEGEEGRTLLADVSWPLGLPSRRTVFRAMGLPHHALAFPIQNSIPFTIYDLRKIMALSDSGKIYSDIKTALLRIAKATVHSKRAF